MTPAVLKQLQMTTQQQAPACAHNRLLPNAAGPQFTMSAAAPAARHAATNSKHAATSKQQSKTADVCLKLVRQISEAASPHFIFADRQLWILNCSNNVETTVYNK
jgi:hypothetical protein